MVAEVETHNLVEPLKAFFGFGGFKGHHGQPRLYGAHAYRRW